MMKRRLVVTLLAGALPVVALGSAIASAAPPKPKPKMISKAAPKLIAKPAVKRPARPIVRPIVPARMGVVPGVAVRVAVPVYRPTLVTQRVISATPVTTVGQLATVPREEVVKEESCQVTEVGEDYGVTVMVEGVATRVRMLGLEPPLVATPEQPSGRVPREAVQFVRNLLVGEFVGLRSDPGLEERDGDGNLAAYLYRAPDGLLVNLELIRQGYGVASEQYPFEYRDSFRAYQRAAQSAGKGIWAQLPGSSP